MSSMTDERGDDRNARIPPTTLIGVGVDGGPTGRDAIALASMLAGATGAEVMLIGVHVEPSSFPVLPDGMDWKSLQKQAWATVAEARDSLAPDARIEVQSDVALWRALRHVVRFTRAGMLVVGSSHEAREGRARLGHHAGELQEHLEVPLAVAPRAMQDAAEPRLERIGIGFDGRPESQVALELAASLASAAGAELMVRGASFPGHGASLSRAADDAARATGARARAEVTTGRPVDVLRELGEKVDLLVIGSGRTGPAGRILVGGTGHALLRDAPCAVVVAPRPGDPNT
jgi:nucleotide-binding universal stress UspA family protein